MHTTTNTAPRLIVPVAWTHPRFLPATQAIALLAEADTHLWDEDPTATLGILHEVEALWAGDTSAVAASFRARVAWERDTIAALFDLEADKAEAA